MDSAWANVTALGMQAFWTLVVLAIIWAAARAATWPNTHDGRAQKFRAGALSDAVRVLASRLAVDETEPDENPTKLQVPRLRDAS